jgi:UrcA family protein
LTHFTARIASLATFTVIATVAAAAHAQPSVRVSGLDLASAAGKAAFAHRMNAAADEACRDERTFSINVACKAGVRAEVTEKLSAIAPTTSFAALPAAQTQPSVRVSDLDLATTAGKAAFAHRINVATKQVCGDERTFSIQHACAAAVRAEVTEKLASIAPATLLAVR